MPKYRIDLSYLGTEFYGWQSQPDGRAVQDYLNKALTTALRTPTKAQGASRTDSGVHAEHQVAVFEGPQGLDVRRLRMSLSALLPDSIGIAQVQPCAEDFHPITAAQGKLYRYRLWCNRMVHPFVLPYVWQVPETLNLEQMRLAAQTLVGDHDFSSFAAVDGGAKTFRRRLSLIEIKATGPLVNVWVFGDGFLKQMVRNIVGTLLEVGVGRIGAERIPAIMAAKDRTKAGPTAPAQGLSLVRIFYEESFLPQQWLTPGADGFYFDVSLFLPGGGTGPLSQE